MVRGRLLIASVILIAMCCVTIARAEILIGVAGPMTGSNSWFGEQMERGAEMAVAVSTPKAGCSASRCS
jgi:branched-chain amino acid transport system substrate-binding protein